MNLLKDNSDLIFLKVLIKVEFCFNELLNKCKLCNEKYRYFRLCVKYSKCRLRERESF